MTLLRHFRFLLFVLAGLLPGGAQAAIAPVPVGEDVTVLDGHLEWLHADPGTVPLAGQPFVRAPAGSSFGVHAQPVWFRTTLVNEAGEARQFLLRSSFANIDLLDVYLVRDGAVSEQWQTGAARPFATRPLATPDFLFPFTLAPGESVTVYLRVLSATVVNLPLTVQGERGYIVAASGTWALHGFFYGAIAASLLFAGFIWWITRDRTFFDFGIAILLASGYFVAMDGLVAGWFPETTWLQQTLLFFASILSITFTLLFAAGFLDTARRAPMLDRTMRVLAVIALLATALVLMLPALVSMLMAMLLSLAMSALMLVAGIRVMRQGYVPARLFVLAIVVHLASIALLSCGALLEVPGLFALADNVHRLGFVFNLGCFTLALGQRLRLLDEERRRVGENILQASADNRARNEFLSRMSHELRTPMTGVLGMAELLDHTELDTRQRRYLQTLRYSGEILLNLINDVLDHARMEAGRLQLRSEAFDLLRLVDECRMLFQQQPRDSGINLHIDIRPGVSRVVVGDAQRLRQILLNVLLQAFRGAASGPVELRIRLIDGTGGLCFEVGHGGAWSGENADGGHALATARRLIALMGGRFGVQSSSGAGTLYRIELPLFAAS
ncbi:MAG: 7TM diverse intracellular signaling domain-containing protein [Pseudomonadota bacterium]